MTDLTEQWKKGELKLGEHYYYTTIFSPTVHIQNFTRDVISFQDFKETVAEVLAPVPSYEEWKAKLEENARLKERVSKLEKMQYSYTPEEWNMMLRTVNRTKEQNAQFKELLKECREAIGDEIDDCTDPKIELFAKINEVLK